jgi:ABC-type nitrate/sulfonate/bicarbonate transport system substrate-binding protein
VDERMTSGAAENLQLLLDPKSKVDVAFMQGGAATFPAADNLVMLASLYYEPLWVFYRGKETLNRLNQLVGRRIAIGVRGSGTLAFVAPLLKFNGVGSDNSQLLTRGGDDALRALKAGEIDVALYVGGADTPLIQQALHDPTIRLMNSARTDAYVRRFPYISNLALPEGTIDLALNIPDQNVSLIGTKAMLAAREDLHPALINLLLDAARVLHGQQGYFETAGEFPGTAPVDLPVSAYADQHKRFGPSILYRYLPFWVAALVERMIIVIVPLLVILVPTMNYLPQILRWRVRSRIFRWYGELALLERDVATHKGSPPIEQWERDLDRIETAVRAIRTPPKFASEAYTLREHIEVVRRAVAARANIAASSAPGT